jgi:hypothetical protein
LHSVLHCTNVFRPGVNPFCYLPKILVALLCLNLSLPGAGPAVLSLQDVIAGIDKAQGEREQELSGYTAREHYTVRNSHFNQSAELDARVVFQKSKGKTYTVLSRSGPSVLQEHVIGRILKEDARLSGNVERPRNLLTSANYSIELNGIRSLQGTPCYVVKILPRVHNYALIEGEAWFDIKTFSLLRIEGKPAASPSFWTGKPMIEREYKIVDGLSFPTHSRATSKGLLTGKSELTIDYSEYKILK